MHFEFIENSNFNGIWGVNISFEFRQPFEFRNVLSKNWHGSRLNFHVDTCCNAAAAADNDVDVRQKEIYCSSTHMHSMMQMLRLQSANTLEDTSQHRYAHHQDIKGCCLYLWAKGFLQEIILFTIFSLLVKEKNYWNRMKKKCYKQ